MPYLEIISTTSRGETLAIYTGLDATVIANTLIFSTVPAKSAVITEILIKLTTLTNPAGVVPQVGVGTAPGTNDIMALTTLTGLNVTTEYYKYSVGGVLKSGNSIYLNIPTTPATYADYTVTVQLMGFIK